MPGIDVFGDSDYTYVQVANAIAARIESGELERKLPAEPELAKQYGVALGTMRKAMQVLRDRGLIITRHGHGTFAARRE